MPGSSGDVNVITWLLNVLFGIILSLFGFNLRRSAARHDNIERKHERINEKISDIKETVGRDYVQRRDMNAAISELKQDIKDSTNMVLEELRNRKS